MRIPKELSDEVLKEAFEMIDKFAGERKEILGVYYAARFHDIKNVILFVTDNHYHETLEGAITDLDLDIVASRLTEINLTFFEWPSGIDYARKKGWEELAVYER